MSTARIEALQHRLTETEPMTWSFIGDSVTAAGWHTFGSRGYAELVNERLRELGRRRDVVINAGHGGWQVGHLQEELERIALRFAPDVVVIGIGLNDTKEGAKGLEAFRTGFADVVVRLRSAGVTHVITQTPNGTLPTGGEHVVRHLDAYAEAIREISQELDTILVDHHAVWRGTDESSWFHWLGHGCHPNAAGHRVLAREIFRTLGMWAPEKSRTCRLSIP